MEVGPLLRRRREALGYTLEDARAATKIRLRYLQALEDERADQLPAPVYTRGFIRSYASFLGLDGASLAAEWGRAAAEAEAAAAAASEFLTDGPAPGPEPSAPPTLPRKQPTAAPTRSRTTAAGVGGDAEDGADFAPARAPAIPRPRRPLAGQRAGAMAAPGDAHAAGGYAARPAAGRPEAPEPPRGYRPGPRLVRRRISPAGLWVLALVAIVAAAYAWAAQSRSPAQAARAAVTPAVAATHSASAAVPTATPSATPPPATPTVTTSTGVDSSGSALTTYRIAGASSLTVVATATARCWIRVWLNGSTAYTDRTLTPGQSATWRARSQVRLRIGYPSGLQLTVDGLTLPAMRTASPVDAAIVLAAP